MRNLLLAAVSLSAIAGSAHAELRLNQIQVVGTHNSYSQPADPRVFEVMNPLMKPRLDAFMASMTPEMRAKMEDEHPSSVMSDLQSGLQYVHPSLGAQLSSGLRSVELDLNVDHEGGRFLDPLSYRLLKEKGAKDLAPLYTNALREPGLKTLHMVDVDFRSSCPTLRMCLQQMRAWSDANPNHTPVFVLIEPKFQSLTAGIPGSTPLDPFDAKAFAEFDSSIFEIIGRERLVAPDDLRGDHATLEAAALAGAWPTLSQSRGKFVFLMLVPGLNLKTFTPYLEGHPNLEGRAAFVQGTPGMAHTAFMMFDNALTNAKAIPDAVKKGYLVRSRSDIDTGEARVNDVRRRDAALASGAQIVSTDYPSTPNIFGNTYVVKPFTGGARCNPVNAPKACGLAGN